MLLGQTESSSSPDAAATLKIPAPRATNETPTEVLPAAAPGPTKASPHFPPPYDAATLSAPAERKPNAMLWLLGVALILGVSAIVVALIVTRGRDASETQTAQTTAPGNTSPSADSTQPNTAVEGTEVKGTASPAASTAPTSVASPTSATTQKAKEPEQAATPRPAPESTPQPVPSPTPVKPRGPVNGGVLNGKATSLPKPAYPASAKAVRASGAVNVQVTVDENGRVISASAVSGHPLLRSSAVSAARQARFSPTLLSGQPVKVTGVIVYNFALE